MRVATWAIQERERAVARALERLGRRVGADRVELEALLDVVARALVARLSGAALHSGTVAELRAQYGGERLTGATHALAAELRDLAEGHAREPGARAEDRRAITDAADDVVNAFEPDGSVPVEFEDVPRPTLVAAMSELAQRPPVSAEQPRPARALLRTRAHGASTARAMRQAASDVVRSGGVTMDNSAPDEVLLSVPREGAEGVTRLVRAAAAIASAPDVSPVELSMSIVKVEGELLDAVVVAASLFEPARLRFDAATWALIERDAARAPGSERAVDPRAPFSTDRLEQSALLLRPPLCGRADDIASFAQWLLAPTAGAGLTVVHGPAGMGKTSLVRAALAEAGYDDDEAPILWGAAHTGVPTPYAALHAMLRSAAHAPLTGAFSRAHVERMVSLLSLSLPAAERRDLAGAGRAVLSVVGEGDDQETRSARALRLAIRRAFVLVLRALWERAGAARPVVLVVTQADALDGATRDVLELCGAQLGGRLRVVLVSTHKARAAAALEVAFQRRIVEVRPLERADVAELATQMIGAPPDEALLTLLQRLRGHPLSVVQALRYVVESGWLRPREGLFALPAARDVPAKVDRLIALRLERLAPEQRRLLGACALFGGTFSLSVAELLGVRAGLARDDVVHTLTVLADTGVLARVEARPARPLFPELRAADEPDTYCFEHPLVRTLVIEGLLPAERPGIHALVAEAIETLGSGETTALAAQLARHHREAGQPGRSLGSLLVAVRRSARLDDAHGAVELARAALELCGDDPSSAFPFRKELCRLREQGPRKAHRAALDELLRCAEETRDPRRRAEALLSAARFNLRCADAALAIQACERALEELRGLGDARLELAVLRVSAVARSALGELEHIERLRGEILARSAPDDRATRAALAHLVGGGLLSIGDIGAAVEAFNHALVDARASDDPAAEASCLESLALAFGQADRPDVALELVERAHARLDLVGDTQGRARLLLVRAELLLAAGDEGGALVAAERARAQARDSGDEASENAALLVQARAHLARSEPFVAEPLLESLRKRAHDDALRAAVAAATARAKVLRAATSNGSPRERLLRTATTRARDALELAEGGAASPAVVMQGAAALAEALLLEGDIDAAFLHAQRAIEHVEDGPSGPWIEEALLAAAHVAASLGDDEERRDVLTRARDLLARRASRLNDDARAAFYDTPVRAELRRGSPADAERVGTDSARSGGEGNEAA